MVLSMVYQQAIAMADDTHWAEWKGTHPSESKSTISPANLVGNCSMSKPEMILMPDSPSRSLQASHRLSDCYAVEAEDKFHLS